ncbi:MAG: hydroxymethylglutaryl-CoA synthase [Deltaproteobacteria bacterium]|nr:hydroxymethylglutaryl-CoA synthase [Deltaproteobacteria bacterium]
MKNVLSIGIDAIAAYVPKFYLDLKTLADANDMDSAKYYQGLGGHRMAVLAPGEDPVTMAAEAAHTLIQRFEISPTNIGMLVVGTESAVDGAKPIASYVHGILNLPRACRTFDLKHACYSGTAALKMAADWCASRAGTGVQALVITTDVARYGVGSAGEPTQGAGAIAFLVGQNPRLFTLDEGMDAVYSENVMDFWRPHYRSEAVVQGQVSIDSYLNLLERTYSAYEATSERHLRDYDYLLFHVPFPKMAYKGFRRLYEREESIARTGCFGADSMDKAFDKRVKPTLWANREVGNIYTGSLYLSLASLLEKERYRLTGAQLGLFSYGSGCCAEFFSGKIPDGASEWTDRIGLHEAFSKREELDYQQYLDYRNVNEEMARNGSLEAGLSISHGGKYSFRGIADHQRVYCHTVPDRVGIASARTATRSADCSEAERTITCSNSVRMSNVSRK